MPKGTRTVPEVATSFDVCESSVRNWIRTGYLTTTPDGCVSNQSLEKFRHEVVGKEKLNKRANKLHANLQIPVDFKSKNVPVISGSGDLKVLSSEYETSLTTAHRNREGIYYTPDDICKSMLAELLIFSPETTFCDPCCGSGNFIIEAIKCGIQPENIFGFDTDSTAIEITKQRIFNETGYLTDQIFYQDFLDFATKSPKSNNRFDIIATNPPWGKKLPKKIRSELGHLLNAGRSIDSTSLFFLASLKVLKDNGYLTLLLPDSFFKIATFRDARRILLDFDVISLKDYGKRFKGIISKAQSVTMKKSVKTSYLVKCSVNNLTYERPQKTFIKNPLQIINFECKNDDAEVISRIFEKPSTSLAGNAQWGLGIVTGNNNKYCSDQNGKNMLPVLRGLDIHKGFIDNPKTFIPRDLTMYQQVASPEIYAAESKILYRFISSELIFYYDLNRTFCLNSVNMLVVDCKFQISSENLVKFFNSNLINWVYKKLFNTHKVLRSDLEKIPLPLEILTKSNFTETDLLKFYGIKDQHNGNYQIKN